MMAIAAAVLAVPAAAGAHEIKALGPDGPLAGTFLQPADGKPVVIMIPGSGPTDRDGNNPMGVTAAPYRLLAEALAARGIGSVRTDKRGMFGSKAAVPDANNVTIGDYAADVAQWVTATRKADGRDCVWLLGHSEGGLVALVAAQRPQGLCGIILVAAPGRPLGAVLREQLRANPANAPILPPALEVIDRLEQGQRADVSAMHPALQNLFGPAVQGFLIDLFAHDPAALAAQVARPMLIVQGGRDLQVTAADGEALKAAQPRAKYLAIPAMNHVLKTIASDDAASNMAAYADPSLAVSAELVDAVAAFVTAVEQ